MFKDKSLEIKVLYISGSSWIPFLWGAVVLVIVW